MQAVASVPKHANGPSLYSRCVAALNKILTMTTPGVDQKVSVQPTLFDRGVLSLIAATYLTTNSCFKRNSIMEQSKQVVISMLKFDIKTFVVASKKQMNWYRKEFMTQPDKRF